MGHRRRRLMRESRCRHRRHSLLLLLCGAIAAAAAPTAPSASGREEDQLCLPEGIPAAKRTGVASLDSAPAAGRGGDGGTLPLGVFVLEWESATVVSEIFLLLVQEVLGLHARVSGTGPNSWTCVWAMSGCMTTSSFVDGCTLLEQQAHHFCFEAWDEGIFEALEILHMSGKPTPDNLGDMGYTGVRGLYVSESTWRLAWNSSGVALDNPRNYAAPTVEGLLDYFDRMEDMWDLKACGEASNFRNKPSLRKYLNETEDHQGVNELANGDLATLCLKESWFVAPACRQSLETCVPVILSGQGWGLNNMMMLAFFFRMPIAFAVAKNSKVYAELPRQRRVIFFWWFPDVVQIALRPKPILFPPTVDLEKGLPGSGYLNRYRHSRLSKLAAPGVASVAPLARHMAEMLTMNPVHIEALMLRLSEHPGLTVKALACEWILGQRAVWKKWVLDPRQCGFGQGLVGVAGTFLDVSGSSSGVEGSESCAICSPGLFSVDAPVAGIDTFRSFVCRRCPPARFSAAFGATSCVRCPTGRASDRDGEKACPRCNTSTFQNETGQTRCWLCDNSFVTEFQGAESRAECVCPPGSRYDAATAHCTPCSFTGVQCPGGHSIENPGEDTTPLVTHGFMTLPERPLSVFSCVGGKEACPGLRSPYGVNASAPSMCSNGVELSPRCSVCKRGFYGTRLGCSTCVTATTATSKFFFFVLGFTCQLLIVCYLYLRSNSKKTLGVIIAGCTLSFLQLLQTVLALPLTWPQQLLRIADIVDLFSSEGYWSVFQLRPECVWGANFESRLAWQVVTPMMPVLDFAILAALGRLVQRPLQWRRVANVCAQIFGSLFTLISGVTLAMFTPELMPNGWQMTKEFPEIRLGSPRWQAAAPISALACCIYCGGFFSYMIHFVITAPRRVSTNPEVIVQYRFVLNVMRPESWWWIILMLAQSFSVRLVQTLSGDVHVSIYLSILVMSCMLRAQIFVRPYRFEMINHLDACLKLTIVMVLICSSSFVEASLIKDFDSHRWAVIINVLVVLVLAYFAYNFARWLYEFSEPPVTRESKRIQEALKYRDVFAELQLLPEKDFLTRMCQLEDVDFQLMKDCAHMIVQALLWKRASRHLHLQRLIPNQDLCIWDPRETTRQVLEDHMMTREDGVQSRNARIRWNMRRLAKLQAKEPERESTRGRKSTRRLTSRWSSDGQEAGISTANEPRKSFDEQRFSLLLDMSGSEMLDCKSFVDKFQGVPGVDMSRDELGQLFEAIDLHRKGVVSLSDLVTIIMGQSPASFHPTESRIANWSSRLASLLPSWCRGAASTLATVCSDKGPGGASAGRCGCCRWCRWMSLVPLVPLLPPRRCGCCRRAVAGRRSAPSG